MISWHGTSAGRRSIRRRDDEPGRDVRTGRPADTGGHQARDGHRTGEGRARPRLADPGRGGRQPQPVGRERRAAVDRAGLRRVADRARPRRGRLLARARGVRPVARRPRRPLRPQAHAHPRRRPVDPGLPARRVRPDHRGPHRRPDPRRRVRRHGLPDDPRPHRRPVVGPGPDALDRPVVGARRRHRRARAAGLGLPPRALRVELGLPRHAAAGGRRPGHGPPLRAGPHQRDDRAGRQPRRRPVGRPRRLGHPRHQLPAGPGRAGPGARAHRRSPSSPASRSSIASSAPRARCTTCRSPAGACSGSRPAPGSSSSGR